MTSKSVHGRQVNGTVRDKDPMHSEEFPTGTTPEEFDNAPAAAPVAPQDLDATSTQEVGSVPAAATDSVAPTSSMTVPPQFSRDAQAAIATSARAPFSDMTNPSYGGAPRPARRRRWPLWTAAALLVLFGAVGVGGFAYASHYSDLAVPGTSIAGTDVSGMSREQIITLVEDKASNATVAISGDVQATATLTDIGTTVDAEATADAAMARGASVTDRFRALFGSQEISVVSSNNEAASVDYAISLIPDDISKAKNASVVLGADNETFEITPASSGTSLDASILRDAAQQAASTLTSTSVTMQFQAADPAVSDEEAQKVADTANEWVAQDVTVTSADGEESFTADAPTKASWITVTAKDRDLPTLSVDSTKVATWVNEQATEVNTEPITGQRNVNSRGEVVATPVEAEDGQSVNNATAVAEAIASALNSGTAYSGTFEMTVTPATWEERTIADGAENLAYPAAPNEKWVDVDLSNKTVTAYEGATVVRGPVLMVDGAAETPTVTGTYHVYLKYESQTMRGENADGTPYVSEDVPWVTYWYSGYALHGAPWRSSFGYSGSHGCVNMPVDQALWFYNWTEIGTTVVSHY
ncbi:L,D-transpeptidase family protein [Actinomyces oricola]|uniref:L,D-transpeptidase family protein n=1 Tax=Actinomyces oricola TaxID=206043 RepID=UPI001F4F2511|nr:L,D-transpeptidase family protein [Actinomyces oricola]